MIQTSSLDQPTDKPIVLRLNYTENREKFEIMRMIGNKLRGNYTKVPLRNIVDAVDNITVNPNCGYGDFFLDDFAKSVYLCISPLNK